MGKERNKFWVERKHKYEKPDSKISEKLSLKAHLVWVTLYLKMFVDVEVPVEAGGGDEGWDGGEVGEV